MAIGVGNTVRVSAVAENFNGETVVTTWDVQVLTVGANGITGLREDLHEFIEAIYQPLEAYISASVTPLRLEFYSRSSNDYIPPMDWTTTTFTAAGSEMPANASAYIVFPTAQRGTRGRKFIFNTIEDYNAGGMLTAGYITQLGLAAAIYIAGDTYTNGWEFKGRIWSDVWGSGFDPISYTVGDQWGTTTRRKTGN